MSGTKPRRASDPGNNVKPLDAKGAKEVMFSAFDNLNFYNRSQRQPYSLTSDWSLRFSLKFEWKYDLAFVADTCDTLMSVGFLSDEGIPKEVASVSLCNNCCHS